MASQKFAKDSAMSMAKSAAAFAGGTLAVSALTRKFSELSQEFDRFGKLATRFEMPVETVQKMSLAANLTGTSIERMNAALTKATVAGVEAQKGIKTYAEAFADLNIDVEKFNQLSPDEKIRVLGEAFKDAESEAVAFTAAYRILGKAGADLVPMLRDVAGAMDQASEARFLSEDQVRRVEEMNDRMAVLSTTLKTDLMEAFLNLEPVITKMVGLVSDFANGVSMLTGGEPVDDPTARSFVKPGSGMEALSLGDREAALIQNLKDPNKTPEQREAMQKSLERVRERIGGLSERNQHLSKTQSIEGQMRANGSTDEAIKRFLEKRMEQLRELDKGENLRTTAGNVNLAVNEAMRTIMAPPKSSGSGATGGSGASPTLFGPVPMPAEGLYDAKAIEGAQTMSFEDLTGGAMKPDLFEIGRKAAAFKPVLKTIGKATAGKAALGGGLDGIAAEGSSFGQVGFGGLEASMKAEGNQRIGNPQKLGKEKKEEKKLNAAEKQIDLLKKQNDLLERNLMVK